jgi:anti-sigma factor RsiW
VKPWFNGKLDYAPAVNDLAAEGFPLIGGRLDFVDHRPVAALIYGRRKHTINLFCWPTGNADQAELQQLDRNGFHLVHWTQGGLQYWALSDLNAAELAEFAKLVQGGRIDADEK